VQRYPIHVVCAWLGNTAAVAAEHYLQVTEDHFASAAQIPAQSGTDRAGQRESALPGGNEKALVFKGFHLKSILVNTYDYPQGDSNTSEQTAKTTETPCFVGFSRCWVRSKSCQKMSIFSLGGCHDTRGFSARARFMAARRSCRIALIQCRPCDPVVLFR
jgi:hypothetical protein